MAIKKAYPPNYAEILKAIPQAQRPGVIFAYWPDIYVPSGNDLPDHLLHHETVHLMRQEIIGVDEWWRQYLTDLDFRYQEELLAHATEYDRLLDPTAPRNHRRAALKMVATRLSSSLYGTGRSMQKVCGDIEMCRKMMGEVAA